MFDDKAADRFDKFYGFYWRTIEVYFGVFGFGVHVAAVIFSLIKIMRILSGAAL